MMLFSLLPNHQLCIGFLYACLYIIFSIGYFLILIVFSCYRINMNTTNNITSSNMRASTLDHHPAPSDINNTQQHATTTTTLFDRDGRQWQATTLRQQLQAGNYWVRRSGSSMSLSAQLSVLQRRVMLQHREILYLQAKVRSQQNEINNLTIMCSNPIFQNNAPESITEQNIFFN